MIAYDDFAAAADARADALRDAAADDGPRRSGACQCDSDMPGRCPGPANCPMCDDDED